METNRHSPNGVSADGLGECVEYGRYSTQEQGEQKQWLNKGKQFTWQQGNIISDNVYLICKVIQRILTEFEELGLTLVGEVGREERVEGESREEREGGRDREEGEWAQPTFLHKPVQTNKQTNTENIK